MEKAFKLLHDHPKLDTVWFDAQNGETYFTRKTATCKRVTRQDMTAAHIAAQLSTPKKTKK